MTVPFPPGLTSIPRPSTAAPARLVNLLLEAVACLAGVALVITAIMSAMRVLVVPRSSRDRIARTLFFVIRRLFDLWTLRMSTYTQVDRLMAWFAPTGLLVLVVIWLMMVLAGYTGIFLLLTGDGCGTASYSAVPRSLPSGFASPGEETGTTAVALSEAAIGLILIALLIAYLPRCTRHSPPRDAGRHAGSTRRPPPSPIELLARYRRIQALEQLGDLWERWEAWFVELEETHTSLPALTSSARHAPSCSWITAAGTVLDARPSPPPRSTSPRDSRADLCIRAGYLALQNIASFFEIPHDPRPPSGRPHKHLQGRIRPRLRPPRRSEHTAEARPRRLLEALRRAGA